MPTQSNTESELSLNPMPFRYEQEEQMPNVDFPIWYDRVLARLAEIERVYELGIGEMLKVSNTSTRDLVELHGYGWTAAEASACIVESAGLR